MGNLTCVCADSLTMIDSPICGALDYGYPKFLLFMRTDGDLVCAGSDLIPTVAELQTALALATVNKIIMVGPMTNGVKAEAERQEESGADTIDGLVTTISQSISIDGRLKFLNEALIREIEKLRCFERLRMWYITHKGFLFGQCEGYNVANFISEQLHDGFGTRGYIPLNYRFIAEDTNPAAQDDGYLTLSNP